MAPTDFLRLYTELGIAPEATLEDLKQAYRRRVSELHPDRQASVEFDVGPERLQQLTALYGAATDFHRRYGRLPGGAAIQRPPLRSGVPYRSTDTPLPESRKRHSSKMPWLVSAGVLLIGWLAFAPPWPDSPPVVTPEAADYRTYVPPVRHAVDASSALHIGMTADDVRAVQGLPVVQGDDRWEYGPSWISFEKKKVSDWYSSPLQPLKYASAHPPARMPTAQSPRSQY